MVERWRWEARVWVWKWLCSKAAAGVVEMAYWVDVAVMMIDDYGGACGGCGCGSGKWRHVGGGSNGNLVVLVEVKTAISLF